MKLCVDNLTILLGPQNGGRGNLPQARNLLGTGQYEKQPKIKQLAISKLGQV